MNASRAKQNHARIRIALARAGYRVRPGNVACRQVARMIVKGGSE